jgi:hypothetical protein
VGLLILWLSCYQPCSLPFPTTSFFSTIGKPLPSDLTGGGPAPVGCKQANLGSYYGIARSIADDEIDHVRTLREVLQAGAVVCPKVDIGPAFARAANAAFNTTLRPAFDPYANPLFFIHGAFIFEDVGVSAYQGAATSLTGDILTAAAGILGVEAYHAGAIRTLLIQSRNVSTPYKVKVRDIVEAISTLRDNLDGNEPSDRGIIWWEGKNARTILAPVAQNGITKPRTTRQVLNIVYGGTGNKGLFFPDGLNGNVK